MYQTRNYCADGTCSSPRGVSLSPVCWRRVIACVHYSSMRRLLRRSRNPSMQSPQRHRSYVCDPNEFASITGFNLHRGCLALAERPRQRSPADVRRADLILVLEGVTDADNVGGAFRNAAAFGIGGVLLSPTCCDPLYRKAIRTSMGAALRVPYARFDKWPDGLEALKVNGFRLVALTPKDAAVVLASCAREPGQKMPYSSGAKVRVSVRLRRLWPICVCAFQFAPKSIR